MFLLVPGMCVLISWLPAANQGERAGGVFLVCWLTGDPKCLRFLLYQTRLIMADEVQVFLWWEEKQVGQTSDQIVLFSSGNQFKSRGVTKILNL